MATGIAELSAATKIDTQEAHALPGKVTEIVFMHPANILATAGFARDGRTVETSDQLRGVEVVYYGSRLRREADMPLALNSRQENGIFTILTRMYTSSSLITEMERIKPELLLDFMLIMEVRRRTNMALRNLYQYFDIAYDYGKFFGRGELSGFSNPSGPEDLPQMLNGTAASWGFEKHQVMRYGALFDQFLQSRYYEQTDRHIVKGAIAEPYPTEAETREAVFNYFYLNRVFPANTETSFQTRQAAFTRLGLPSKITYQELEDTHRWASVNAGQIGNFFTSWGKSFIRTKEQKAYFYRS